MEKETSFDILMVHVLLFISPEFVNLIWLKNLNLFWCHMHTIGVLSVSKSDNSKVFFYSSLSFCNQMGFTKMMMKLHDAAIRYDKLHLVIH